MKKSLLICLIALESTMFACERSSAYTHPPFAGKYKHRHASPDASKKSFESPESFGRCSCPKDSCTKTITKKNLFYLETQLERRIEEFGASQDPKIASYIHHLRSIITSIQADRKKYNYYDDSSDDNSSSHSKTDYAPHA